MKHATGYCGSKDYAYDGSYDIHIYNNIIPSHNIVYVIIIRW